MRILILCISLFLPIVGIAAAANITIGPAAENALGVVSGVTELIGAVLYIASTIMFISAILKLRIHRQNPQQVPIATPITEFVLAIILGALPYITELASHSFVDKPPSVLLPHMQQQQQKR